MLTNKEREALQVALDLVDELRGVEAERDVLAKICTNIAGCPSTALAENCKSSDPKKDCLPCWLKYAAQKVAEREGGAS